MEKMNTFPFNLEAAKGVAKVIDQDGIEWQFKFEFHDGYSQCLAGLLKRNGGEHILIVHTSGVGINLRNNLFMAEDPHARFVAKEGFGVFDKTENRLICSFSEIYSLEQRVVFSECLAAGLNAKYPKTHEKQHHSKHDQGGRGIHRR